MGRKSSSILAQKAMATTIQLLLARVSKLDTSAILQMTSLPQDIGRVSTFGKGPVAQQPQIHLTVKENIDEAGNKKSS
jgi:hypothetical protein